MNRNITKRAALLFIAALIANSSSLIAQSTGSAVTLNYVAGSTVKVEQMIGDCDWQVKATTGNCSPTASQTATRYNIMGTDLGSSFEHNGKLIIPFGDTISVDTAAVNYGAGDSIAWSTSTNPDAGLSLNFYTNTNGTPLFVRMPGANINMGGNNVPNAGISLPSGIYLLCNIGADTPAGKPSDRSILVKFDETTQTFTPGRTVSTLPGRFIHGALYKSGSDVMIFGAGDYRASDIYLSVVPASSFETGTGTRYFAGLVNGQPQWSSSESAAVPVVQDNPLNGPGWPNGSPTVGNMSVVYVDALKLWVMTYDGGRVSPTARGVYFTYAQEPWGPWAAPQLIFNDTREAATGTFIHNPAIVPNPPGDGLNGPTIGGNDPYTTPGGAYAPFMIARFTTVTGDTLKIHYTLSTWNPYTVVRMRSEFKIAQGRNFSIPNRGGTSVASTGSPGTVSVGYGRIQPDSGNTSPAGVAIFSFRKDNAVVSEVGVPAVGARTSGRLYAEIAGSVTAGVAIANPGASPATISFQLTDAAGNAAGSGSTTIPANQQIAQFLHQPPFNVYRTATFQGTFTFTSNVPVAVVALRGLTNERGDFLMSTLPVVDYPSTAAGTLTIPHFADGGGWTTQVLLVNPTDETISGSVQFLNASGSATDVTIGGQTASSFNYSIPRRASQKLATSGFGASTASGSIRITPGTNAAGPVPLTVFTYRAGGVTLSEAGVPVTTSNAFRVYAESSGAPGQTGSIDSGIAVANPSSSPATVTFDLTDLGGAPVPNVAAATLTVPAAGQTAKFLSDIFPALPRPFKGLLRITTTTPSISVVGLRTRTNERREFLITTTPPANENSSAPTAELFFPQVADGGGYTTQFILYSGTAGQAPSGLLKFTQQDGSIWSITFSTSN